MVGCWFVQSHVLSRARISTQVTWPLSGEAQASTQVFSELPSILYHIAHFLDPKVKVGLGELLGDL
jgi:hypothetical protein